MSNNIPSNADLPSKAHLIKSTIIAVVIATVILITAVLPAEYGIDPTGIGKVIGLVKMGEIKTSLSKEAALESVNEEPGLGQVFAEIETEEAESRSPHRKDRMTVTNFKGLTPG